MRCISVLSKIIYTLLCKYDAYTPSPEMENRNTFARGSAYSPDFQTQVSEIETSSYEAKAPYTDIVTDLLSAEKIMLCSCGTRASCNASHFYL